MSAPARGSRRARRRRAGAAVLAAVLALAPAAGAAGLLKVARGDIRTGEDYLDACGSSDDLGKQACRNPLLAEVLTLQANQRRSANPFTRCPVDVREIEALEKLSEHLQQAFVAWLEENEGQQDEPLGGLVHIALREIDVCSLQ